MIILSFILFFGSLFLSIAFIITGFLLNKYNKKYFLFKKNILLNIGLIIFSGIAYMFYEKIFTNYYIEQWPSIFIGIIVMFGIWFFNFAGIIYSIKNITKVHLVLIVYGLFIISTIFTYNIINIIEKILENNKIISECSSIILIGVIMTIENILSYIIVKNINRKNNGVRGNCT